MASTTVRQNATDCQLLLPYGQKFFPELQSSAELPEKGLLLSGNHLYTAFAGDSPSRGAVYTGKRDRFSLPLLPLLLLGKPAQKPLVYFHISAIIEINFYKDGSNERQTD
jgi:hypothetical protein